MRMLWIDVAAEQWVAVAMKAQERTFRCPSGVTDMCLRRLLTGLVPVSMVLLAMGPSAALAQSEPAATDRVHPFLDNIDVFFAPDVKYEAHLQPNLTILDSLTSLLRSGESGRAYVLTGTPGIRLRMFPSVSSPVRTPSYMPKGTFQYFVVPTPTSAERDIWEFHFTAGHHSNGQDGCLYINEGRRGEKCPLRSGPLGPILEPSPINRRDGSFSTNYLRGGMNYRHSALRGESVSELTAGAELEFHPKAFISDRIADLYGRTRPKISGSVARKRPNAPVWTCPSRLEGKVDLTYVIGIPDQIPFGDKMSQLIVSAQTSCFPFKTRQWGFFARYYRGQDYYNLGFADMLNAIQVGLTFSEDGFRW